MKVYRSMVIPFPIDEVWASVRAFDGVSTWNPAVAAATMESGTATTVGAVRRLEIVDGNVFRETLLAHSDLERFYSYDILESPLPVTDYRSTHRFIEITAGKQTLSIWEGRFDCAPAEAEDLAKLVGDEIYLNGMEGLSHYLAESSGKRS